MANIISKESCLIVVGKLNTLRDKNKGEYFTKKDLVSALKPLPNERDIESFITKLVKHNIISHPEIIKNDSGRRAYYCFIDYKNPIHWMKIKEIETQSEAKSQQKRKYTVYENMDIKDDVQYKMKEHRKRFMLQEVQLCQLENKFEYEHIFQKYYNGEDDLIKTLRLVKFPDIRFEEINKILLENLEEWICDAMKKRQETAYVMAENRINEENIISDLKRIESKLDKIIKYLEL